MTDIPLQLDFGSAPPAPGFAKADADCRYAAERGYGFEEAGVVTARDRGEPGPLKRDLCIPAGAVFRVDLPDGNYAVSLLSGDPIAPSSTFVTASPRRPVLRRLDLPAGQFARESFAVHVRGGCLRLAFSGEAPRLNALEIAPAPESITLYLAGDSTVTDQPEDGFPYAGWGQMLQRFFKHDVAVANYAVSGRSSKSFAGEGRLDEIAAKLRAGDWLFVQFGHNDQKSDEARHTDPGSTYKLHLKMYIEAARERGAHPVLVTPVHRRKFAPGGALLDTHGAYVEAVRELAADEGVPLVDLAAMSARLFESLGPSGTESLFMHGAPGEFANYPAGVADDTHFQERGAEAVAALVVQRVRELALAPLFLYLR
ncbi:GDSL-type esterase/lipase family protein [Cohnella ginsengisoli]|uniref:GDSL-type esterase/lipase family protein n=1 Tax=Cohnella ginsengisoli TaxID=425004 RepID=A0A9X4KJ66_9BACL|nr:GDSL-type esterase/lipase family protein [Cohnella ginsengisoli]MDG0792459.1 GDSL-type esterase/lipase family protein [Cohnella ginsengisoli]